MQCLLGDNALSLGLVTVPLTNEHEFFQDVIEPIFSGYADNVRRFFRDGGDPQRAAFESLYRPLPYYLFGRFDLALLYLVDDHDFSCRTLRPFHPAAKRDERQYHDSFDHKVMFGPMPLLTRQGAREMPGAIELVNKLGSRPLLALTQLKVSNSLLLGGGAAFLRLVISFINGEAKKLFGDADAPQSIVLESYAWHEITLVTLGTSYGPMLQLVASLRDATYRDVIMSARRRARSSKEREDLKRELATMKHLIGGDLGWPQADVDRAPVFGHVTTNLGFDFRMFRERERLNEINPQDRIHLLSRWFVKPGRLAEFERLVIDQGDAMMSSVGRGDVWYPASTAAPDAGQREPLTTYQAIKGYLEVNERPGLDRAATQRYTHIALSQPSPRPRRPSRSFSRELKKLRFRDSELRQIDRALRTLRVPKVLIHRLSNVYSIFNDSSLDRSLYASFAELRPFLARLAAELTGQAAGTLPVMDHEQLCTCVRKWAELFERAHRNRFHNSERMGEVTDFNFEFKGGIQQVVTAFDAAYKALSSVLGSRGGVVSVGGDEGVESSACDVRLNYFHVFQPEMFFAIAGKEASNWFLTNPSDWVDEIVWLMIGNLSSLDEEEERAACLASWMGTLLRRARVAKLFASQIAEYADVDFLRTHLADLLTFQACYAGNWELFSHWMLGAFLQNVGVDEPAGVFSQLDAARFLFRLRMIAGDMSEEAFAASIHAFGDPDIGHVYEGLAADRQQVERVRRAVLRQPVFGAWFDSVRRLSERIAAFALTPRGERQDLSSAQASARVRAKKHREAFELGRVPRFEPTDFGSAFRFCQEVLYGYLLLLMDEIGVRGGQVPRLHRGVRGMPRIPKNAARLLFDPLGGVFSHEPQTRRKLFKYRSAVTMSLWDLGLKTKRDALVAQMG